MEDVAEKIERKIERQSVVEKIERKIERQTSNLRK
jgi:hypothetical protein